MLIYVVIPQNTSKSSKIPSIQLINNQLKENLNNSRNIMEIRYFETHF